MKTISYIAMIATAAFCQLSSCMNQPNNPVNGNQSSPAACTFDMWTVKVPVGFSVTFAPTNDRVAKVDFDTKKVHFPYMPNLSVFCTGPEVMGSTSLSIDHSRLHTFTIPTGNSHALPMPPVNERLDPFTWSFVQTGKCVVSVNLNTKQAFVPLRANIQVSTTGSECSTSLSIVRKYPDFSTIQNVTQHASPTPFVETHPTTEMKEEKVQRRMDSQTKTRRDSELSETLKKSKPPKAPKDLKAIENSNSHTEEVNKKKTKQIDKIDCESFLNKYSKPTQPLDDYAKELIKNVFDSGIRTPTAILDELLTPSNTITRGPKFEKVRKRVESFIYPLRKEWRATQLGAEARMTPGRGVNERPGAGGISQRGQAQNALLSIDKMNEQLRLAQMRIQGAGNVAEQMNEFAGRNGVESLKDVAKDNGNRSETSKSFDPFFIEEPSKDSKRTVEKKESKMKEEMSSKDTGNGSKSPKPVNPFLSEDVSERPKPRVEKKESKMQSEMMCQKFLEKYSTHDLDDEIKRQIERFAKKGDKSPNVILEKLSGSTCPPMMTVEWANVADKVRCYLVKQGHIQIGGKYVNS